MQVIVFLNEKGGVGKSSVSANFSAALHRQGKKVVLVDADPQGTARDWRSASPENANLPPVVALDRPEMMKSIKTLDAEFVIVDTPAKAEKMTAAAIGMADTAIIVMQPSAADIWASAAAVKMIQQKLDLGGKVNAAFLANRVSAGTKLSKEVIAGEWNEYGIAQLKTTIGNRVAFAQALSDGLSIYDTTDTAGKAEIDALINEMKVLKWL